MFCSKCGNTLPDNARFCARCGTPVPVRQAPQQQPAPARPQPVQSQPQVQAQPVRPQPAQAQAQPQPVRPQPAQPQTQVQAQTPGQQSAQPQKTVKHAAFLPGESFLSVAQGAAASAAQTIPGTGDVLGGGISRFFKAFGTAFKDPKRLIPALVLAVVWLVLNILQAKGINPLPTKLLSFLTFAEGGMHGGIIGAIGGIVGKGVVAGALTSLVMMFTRKGQGSSGGFAGAFGVNGATVGPWLTGMGAAFLLYLFFSGGATRSAFICGAAACFLAARAALKRGFLQTLIGSFTSKGKTFAGPVAIGITRGLAAGFAAAALFGFLNNKWLILIPGALLIAAGIVLMIVRAAGKKPASGGAAA